MITGFIQHGYADRERGRLVGAIVHEALHAYLQYKAGTEELHDKNHSEIANEYVKPMVDFLKLAYPNLGLPAATAIAWGGLQNTLLWKDSFKNDDFDVGFGQKICFETMKGLQTAHRYGYADNSTSPCGN